ncbi:MAG: hypothetical protein HQL74_07380 [Magnetococcales bacterium]|nr:hypothetical protein [Magnetococcales bacterium]
MSSTSPHARDPGAPLPPSTHIKALQTLRDAARAGQIDRDSCQRIGIELLSIANPELDPNRFTAALILTFDAVMGLKNREDLAKGGHK